jgi:hypothetical protein
MNITSWTLDSSKESAKSFQQSKTIIQFFLDNCSPEEMRWIVRIILKRAPAFVMLKAHTEV